MLYNSYRENVLYSSQPEINFPRIGEDGTPGFGNMLFLMCPNQDKAIEFIDDPYINLVPSYTKRYITDTIYREKIGVKRIIINERILTDKKFMSMKDFPLMYIPNTSRMSAITKKYNMVNDLSRWMELFFTYYNISNAKRSCSEFIRILKDRINDPTLNGYNKILIFDLNTWVKNIKSCVVMNRQLLNNPLSMFLYTANYFPEFLEDFPQVQLMIINRANKQLFLINTKDITKKNYAKIKSKLSLIKNIVFSVEDTVDSTISNVNEEVTAEVVNSFKEDLRKSLKYNLLGSNSSTSPFDEIADITTDTADPFTDMDAELNDANNDPNAPLENPDNAISIEDDITGDIERAIQDEFDNIDEIESVDTEEISKKITEKITQERYSATFMPTRTKEQTERIKRLTQTQSTKLPPPTIEDVKRKSIEDSVTGGYIKTTNPNILSSKFINFDKGYTEKCLEKNIDEAVAILSSASEPIFVIDKIITDSSTPMDLKVTYTYKLEDSKGNKMSLTFDVPKIIENNYVYLNGTKKNIRHQFILKPIVKTGPDTVQIVTAYNKVFVRRKGAVNQNINRLWVLLEKNPETYSLKTGNCSMKNLVYQVPLDYAMLSRYCSEFTVGDITYFMSIDACISAYKLLKRSELTFDSTIELPIGINTKTKTPIILPLTESYTDMVYNSFSDEDKLKIRRIKRKPKSIIAKAKIMGYDVPLILFMMYCEGFASVMKKANISYEFVDKNSLKNYDAMKYDIITLENGYIVWSKENFRNELLMNGFNASDLSDFTYEDLESKDTFISLVGPYYPNNMKIFNALDNFRDFLLDAKTKEILTDFGYPTDLVSLLVVAAGMLSDNTFLPENNMNNMRIRSNEVIADLVYTIVTNAYTDYRATSYKKNPSKLSIKKSILIDTLLDSDTNMIEEFSVLNPVLELEKQRAVTFKGIRGIQMDRAMTLPRRAYDKTMLGTIGITTSPDANVGVVRQLTLEPQITSTYGYIDTEKCKDPNNLTSANLFTTAELLQPFGVTHDDPDRTSMSYKQTKYMVPIADSDPVLIGNKVEAVVPYLLSNEFIVTAKKNGKVIEITKDFCIIEYDDGERYAIDISTKVSKNSSAGFWIDNSLRCDLKIGNKFKEGDVLAYNDKHFTKNEDDPGASMNLGSLCKIAISSQWDVFEDSAPISKRLSEKISTEMIDEKHITLSPYTFIDYMVNIGDNIKAGDTLIKFSDAMTDEMQKLFDSMRAENKEAVIEDAKTTITSKYTGEICDIKIYTTVEPKDLDPSLQKIVEDYQSRISARNATLDKFKNDDDLAYYKAGQIISEIDDVVQVGKNGKVKGYEMPTDGVLILFYIKYSVAASKGDKVVVSVCKGIISHVFEEGQEPYSEYRPDEVIDTIVAPLAVAARKVPAIFLTIFGNKLIIELKRQLKDIYLD